MTGFINQILAELKSNSTLASNPLVKMLVESTDKSIALGENAKTIYSNLKEGINAVNASLNNSNLSALLEQFNKLEDTPEAQVEELARKANITSKLAAIRESKAIANPMFSTQVSIFENYIKAGHPDFLLCEQFVKIFGEYSYDRIVKENVDSINTYLAENRSQLLVLSAIYNMDKMPAGNYSQVSKDLKKMLIEESYTSDILKVKFGNTIPAIAKLSSDLRVVESETLGYFTLGNGDSFTTVNNMIAPATQAKDGFIVFTDNRFVSVRESKSLTGKETKVFVDGDFKIAEVDPAYIKEKFPKFYSVAESFTSLGFAKNSDGTGVVSNTIRNFNLSFKTNESQALDLYLNESKVENADDINIMEALALESTDIKKKVLNLFENTKNLFNFDFIKELSNDRTLAEATIFKLNDSFYVCEKTNTADRNWIKVDEFKLYEFCMNKFNYDISTIFKTKINERIEEFKVIESKKEAILLDVSKLEETLEKIQKTLSNPTVEKDAVKKLEGIKESIETTINALKEDYVGLDIFKNSARLEK